MFKLHHGHKPSSTPAKDAGSSYGPRRHASCLPVSTALKVQCSLQSYPNSTQGTAWDRAQVPQAVRSQPAKQLHRLPLQFFGLPFASSLGFSGSASEGAAASSSYCGAMMNGSFGRWQRSTQHRNLYEHDHNSKMFELLRPVTLFCCTWDALELGSCVGGETMGWEAAKCSNAFLAGAAPARAPAKCTTVVAPYTLHCTT